MCSALRSAGPSRGLPGPGLVPMGHPGTAKQGCFLPCAARPCRHQRLCQARSPPSPGSEAPSPPHSLGKRMGTCWRSLATFCNGDVAGQGVPHLPSGSQLDEGTDGLVGAGPAGKHVAPVEGLEEADEVGTLCLLKGRCC